MSDLLIVGCGYTGLAIAREWQARMGGNVAGTTRGRADVLRDAGVEPLDLADEAEMRAAIASAGAIVISTPPSADAVDPAFAYEGEIAASNAWLAYLSTTAVYGDHGGDWVDETTPLSPSSKRGQARVEAERAWQEATPRVNIFRLAGIYGPRIGGQERGPFAKIRSKRAQKIVKDGQVFGRIHVEDIARIVVASFQTGDRGEIYNVTDDETAPPQDVLDYASEKLGVAPLEAVRFEDAELSPMARSFYGENKRVSNQKIHEHFGALRYPNYRAGLDAIFEEDYRKSD